MNDSRMTSVNEEYDEASNNLTEKGALSDKLKDLRSCNERSDSGFSECSNCSTPSTSCVCNLTLLDKTQSIIEEQSSGSSNEPEDTTESIQQREATADESFTMSSDHDIRSEISSLEYDDANKSTCDDNQNVVVSIRVPTRRELFQDEHGDLLSEIQRRKVSLENTAKKSSSFKHEVALEKLKKSSKVALLMEKFETSNCAAAIPSYIIKPTVTNGGAKGLHTNPISMMKSFDDVKSFVVRPPLADHLINDSNFLAHSKSSTRNSTNPTTTFRLSSRVREVTERLSRPKQQASVEDSGALNRSKDFWKR